MKTRVAVFFGGRSPEHDVSIITGLQALKALDTERFQGFPVYVSTNGDWLLGESLRDQSIYLPQGQTLEKLDKVTLDVAANVEGVARLLFREKRSLLGQAKPVEFDVALLAFHGMFGEDGRVQGVFESANVPYTGMRTFASSVSMDKVATKRILAETGIATLPSLVLRRLRSGFLPSANELERLLAQVTFPVIVKPVHLGSSIGVAKASNIAEVRAALPPIFKLDAEALIEPFVPNLVEYNISVRRLNEEIVSSAIELPKPSQELLDFKSKYWPTEGGKTGGKVPGTSSEGMLSLTREIHPKLLPDQEAKIHNWAKVCFATLGGSGAPRIDFLSDRASGEIWLNELNPCPGSFAFYLWQAAAEPILFTDLLTSLIDEAIDLHRSSQLPNDPTQPDARLFKHP
jgi:D-alanine-D-alanine ligase